MLRIVMSVVFVLALGMMAQPGVASASDTAVDAPAASSVLGAAVRLGGAANNDPTYEPDDAAGPAVPEPSGLLAFAAGALVLRSRLRRR